MLGLTIFETISAIILWAGVFAGPLFASHSSSERATILMCTATGFILFLLAAAGPEGTARLRVPALPFLAIIAGIGCAMLARRLRTRLESSF
jgi:hypothetical protein